MADSYQRHKAKAKLRGIEHTITREQWDILEKIKNDRSTRCAYTEIPFIFKENHKHQASLERLDDRLGYCYGNVVWVTIEVNRIKDRYFDKKTHNIEDVVDDCTRGIINKLNKITKQEHWEQTIWNKQIGAYLRENVWNKPSEDVIMKEETIGNNAVNISTNTTTSSDENGSDCNRCVDEHEDLAFSRNYIKMTKVFIAIGVKFDVSFSDYKKMMQRKVCQLTGNKFVDSDQKHLYVIDKTKSYNFV